MTATRSRFSQLLTGLRQPTLSTQMTLIGLGITLLFVLIAVLSPGGEFKMGSKQPEFIEELPVEDVTVSSFCIDSHEMTNAKFTQFVEDTGYVTVAERPLSKEQFPDLSKRNASFTVCHFLFGVRCDNVHPNY